MNAQLKPERGHVIANEAPESYYRRKLDEASASGLKKMLRSPAHFHHWVQDPDADKSSPALEFGRAFHCATLEPDVFADTYAVLPADAPQRPTAAMLGAAKPSDSSKARQEWWAAFDAENSGRVFLSANDHDRARYMADSVRAHPVAAGLLVGGEREVTFRWHDDETGLACKSRADLYLPGEFLMDLKSCVDASPEGFARAVINYGYDVQQAHYVDGAKQCDDPLRHFIFLACESAAPYVCQPHVLDAHAESRGWTLRQRAITRQAECFKANRWPGYSDRINELTLPAFAFFGIEEAES
jgi:hypothetical protein